jgi:hypothetical protein
MALGIASPETIGCAVFLVALQQETPHNQRVALRRRRIVVTQSRSQNPYLKSMGAKPHALPT